MLTPKNRLATIDASKVPPDRSILNAVEGWGKTSFAAFAGDAAILMARGETGYPTLLKAGLVPSIPAVELQSWTEVLEQIDYLIQNPGQFKAVTLDALGGFERLCHEYVCARDFDGDWGDKGFQAYMRGYDVSISEWLLLLQRLDRLRSLGTEIILLSHAKVKNFKNPDGPDYDRYSGDCHDKTWAATTKWADNIFFGTFETVVLDAKGGIASATTKGRKKGMGGDQRKVFTQRRASYDAKNRWGMPWEIDISDDPSSVWGTIHSYMQPKSATSGSDAPAGDDMPPI